MTDSETTKILAVLKAAYPNAYKGMTREEAFGMIHLWQMQFASIPAELVMTAVNRLIGKMAFVPTVAEVKEELHDIHEDAWEMLWYHSGGASDLTEQQIAEYSAIVQALSPIEKERSGNPILTGQAYAPLPQGSTQDLERRQQHGNA